MLINNVPYYIAQSSGGNGILDIVPDAGLAFRAEDITLNDQDKIPTGYQLSNPGTWGGNFSPNVGNQITYGATAGPNNQPAVVVTNDNYFLEYNKNPDDEQDQTWIGVFGPSNPEVSNGVCFSQYSGSSGLHHYCNRNVSSGWAGGTGRPNGSYNSLGANHVWGTLWFINIVTFDITNNIVSSYIDGITGSTAPYTSGHMSGYNEYRIAGGNNHGFVGTVSEAVAVPRIITAQERADIFQLYSNKYQIPLVV